MSNTPKRPRVYDQRAELLRAIDRELIELSSISPSKAATLRALWRVYLGTLPPTYGLNVFESEAP